MDHKYSFSSKPIFIFLWLLLLGISTTSCTNNENSSTGNDTIVKFGNTFISTEENVSEPVKISLNFSGTISSASTITIGIENSESATNDNYTTTPKASSNKFTLKLSKGDTSASFMVAPVNNNIADGDKTIYFNIDSVSGSIVKARKNLSATFVIRDDETTDPVLQTSITKLDDFGSVHSDSASDSKSFQLTASNLSSDLTIKASTNFELSLDNTNFSSDTTIKAADVTAKPLDVYVRFVPTSGLNVPISGTITGSSYGADDAVVNVSGTESGNSTAQLIFNDAFDYGSSAGDLVSLSDWEKYAGSTKPIQYVTSGLSFSGYAGSGVGGAAVVENGYGSRQDVKRDITTPNAGTVYLAAMVNFKSADTDDDFFLSYRTGSTYFNRLYAKDDGSGNLVLGVSRTHTNSGDTQFDENNTFNYNTTYVIVTKYDFSTEKSSLFVLDGSVPNSEPATANAVASSGAVPSKPFEQVLLRQNQGDISVTVDDIRIAASWKDVLGL